MPRGIVIIDWDAFEGGIISFKYPGTLEVPTNLVQLLQISHTFSNGLLTLKDGRFHAVSVGNETLEKVIVLILSEFEDENDFFDIVNTMNSVVTDVNEEEQLKSQLIRLFQLSQSVFKARDAVLNKLAEEITELKNKEIDMKQSLEWLIRHEESFEKLIIFLLLRYGPLDPGHLLPYINKTQELLKSKINNNQKEKIIQNKLTTTYNETKKKLDTLENLGLSKTSHFEKKHDKPPVEIEFRKSTLISQNDLEKILQVMEENNILKQDMEGRYHLLIHYGFD
ncbi:hypothetical protein [Candidatus Harpocratesius sp.]